MIFSNFLLIDIRLTQVKIQAIHSQNNYDEHN